MKRLYLLRHAKAAPADPSAEDHIRPLTARGIEDAGAMARHLHKNAMQPDFVLVSGAARTRQTAELVLRAFARPPRIEISEALYLAEPGKIFARVQAVPASVHGVMVVGHNPGIEAMAALLAREPVRRKERARHDELEEKFPTGALAILDFDCADWAHLMPGSGTLVDFVRPKDLKSRDL